jgi:hypothetical protein
LVPLWVDGEIVWIRRSLFEPTFNDALDQIVYLADNTLRAKWELSSYDWLSQMISDVTPSRGIGDIIPLTPTDPELAWSLFEKCEGTDSETCTRPFAESLATNFGTNVILSPAHAIYFEGDADGNFVYRATVTIDYGMVGRNVFIRLSTDNPCYEVTGVSDVSISHYYIY